MNEKNIQRVCMEEIWKESTDGHIPLLLEIYNPDIKWDDGSTEQDNMYLRVIDDSNAVIYKGKRYLPCKFTYDPPEENGKSIGESAITISAIDSRVIQILRSIEVQCEVRVMAMFAKKDNQYKFYPLEHLKAKLPSATYDRITAKLQIVSKDVLKLNVPRHTPTKNQLPSINENS